MAERTSLGDANRLGASLWPSELQDLNIFLELLVHDGQDIRPFDKFHLLLQRILSLSEHDNAKLGREEIIRRGTSAAILTAVGLRTFSIKENHYAAICAWTMYSAYWIAACEKHHAPMEGRQRICIELALTAISDSLANLWSEIQTNEKLIGRGLEFRPLHRGRATLVIALMAIYWLWSESNSWLVDTHKAFLENWLPRDFSQHYLWGEAAIPQFLAHYWYLSKTDATSAPEELLGLLLSSVIFGSAEKHMLPSPYYSFEQVIQHLFSSFLKTRDDELVEETTTHSSYYAEGLMHLFVRTNKKRSCALLWPEFTKIGLMHFELDEPWHFSLLALREGQERYRTDQNSKGLERSCGRSSRLPHAKRSIRVYFATNSVVVIRRDLPTPIHP